MRFWVESAEGDSVFKPVKKERDPILAGDLVLVLAGPFKGRWQKVRAVRDGFAFLSLTYMEGDQGALEEARRKGALSDEAEEERVTISANEGGFIVERNVTRKKKR